MHHILQAASKDGEEKGEGKDEDMRNITDTKDERNSVKKEDEKERDTKNKMDTTENKTDIENGFQDQRRHANDDDTGQFSDACRGSNVSNRNDTFPNDNGFNDEERKFDNGINMVNENDESNKSDKVDDISGNSIVYNKGSKTCDNSTNCNSEERKENKANDKESFGDKTIDKCNEADRVFLKGQVLPRKGEVDLICGGRYFF